MFQFLSNNVHKVLYLYSTLLILKVLSMSLLTAKWRLRKRIFISPEDAERRGKVSYEDPDVERIRRAHLNDIENIPIFILSALMYLETSPYPFIATNLIRMYSTSRFLHSYIYVNNVPQPARAWLFRIGIAINLYMIAQTIVHFCW